MMVLIIIINLYKIILNHVYLICFKRTNIDGFYLKLSQRSTLVHLPVSTAA